MVPWASLLRILSSSTSHPWLKKSSLRALPKAEKPPLLGGLLRSDFSAMDKSGLLRILSSRAPQAILTAKMFRFSPAPRGKSDSPFGAGLPLHIFAVRMNEPVAHPMGLKYFGNSENSFVDQGIKWLPSQILG